MRDVPSFVEYWQVRTAGALHGAIGRPPLAAITDEVGAPSAIESTGAVENVRPVVKRCPRRAWESSGVDMKTIAVHYCPVWPVKASIAARVAAQLQGADTQVETHRGKLGELRVTVDGRDVYAGSRFLYPRPKTVLTAVRGWLAGNARSS